MKIIKFRRPFFKDSYPYEFSHFSEWGVELGNYSFTAPAYNNNCTHKEDQMFTGLQDRLGKEIYEGDVLQLIKTHAKIFRREVIFEKGCFGFYDTVGVFYPLAIPNGNKKDEKQWEVIGNIYENESLLK